MNIERLPFGYSQVDLSLLTQIAGAWVSFYGQNSVSDLGQIIPVCMKGTLGAGKTTFIRECFIALDILPDIQKFSSPSFTIVKEYHQKVRHGLSQSDVLTQVFSTVCHIDLYKIHSMQEIDEVGIFDIIAQYPSFIEWSERLDSHIPHPHYMISLDIVSEKMRDITIEYFE